VSESNHYFFIIDCTSLLIALFHQPHPFTYCTYSYPAHHSILISHTKSASQALPLFNTIFSTVLHYSKYYSIHVINVFYIISFVIERFFICHIIITSCCSFVTQEQTANSRLANKIPRRNFSISQRSRVEKKRCHLFKEHANARAFSHIP
jgi:hypothetical protein